MKRNLINEKLSRRDQFFHDVAKLTNKFNDTAVWRSGEVGKYFLCSLI